MNLRHLTYFVRIAELGSFTKAAQRLRIAQPALTRHIRQLEGRLGVELFFRSNRGVILTEAGKHLFENAVRVLHDIERAYDEMRAFTGSPAGKVVLGVTPSLCPVVVPPLLSQHRRSFPAVELKILESFGAQLEEWLVDRRIDLAIHTGPAHSKALAGTPLVCEEMVLVTGPHQRADGAVSARELGALPLTMTESLRTVVERLLEPFETTLAVETTLNAIPTILLMVREGLCASIVPYSTVRGDVDAGTLSAHAVTEQGLSRELVLSANATRPISGATQAVAREIQSLFEALEAAGAFRFKREGHAGTSRSPP